MKRLLRNYITDAVLLILLGLVLLFKPGGTLEFFCKILGIVLLVLGAVKALQFFITKDKANKSILSLLVGAVQGIFGIWLLANPGFFISFVPTVAGVVIAYGAIISIMQAIKAKKAGASDATLAIICSVVTLMLAIIVILHPAAISAMMIQLIGVSLIIEGVTLLIALSR